MKRIQQLSFLIFTMLLLHACGPKQESETTDSEAIDEAFVKARDTFFNSIRQPDETAASLMSIGADFNGALLHDPSQWSTYIGSKEKSAALLGIYLSDLNYSVAFKQTGKVEALFDAIHALSLEIGVEKSILEYLMARYKNNIDQNDSVRVAMDDMYVNAIQSTRGTDREVLTGIAIAAHQIEDLHIMMGIIETYPKDILPDDVRIQVLIPLFQTVLHEKPAVESVHNFLSVVGKNDSNGDFYITSLQELIDTYNELNVDEKIANNQGIDLMNDQTILKLDNKVTSIRNAIITP